MDQELGGARPAQDGLKAVVTGAGGFIGHHLVKKLRAEGFFVVGVGKSLPPFEQTSANEFHQRSLLTDPSDLAGIFKGAAHVYHMAADMGGIGYIQTGHSKIFRANMTMDMNVLEAARIAEVARFFYPSSACVYPETRTNEPHSPPLKEEFAYPAQPVDAYGWEKLMGERLCTAYRLEHGLQTRIARFHTMYGPLGTWKGGREKFPFAICRKVAEAEDGDSIEVWGDGEQTRTFCYIEDTLEGIRRLMESEVAVPVNIGSAELLSVNQTANLVIGISGKRDLRLKHVPGPQGLRGRAPDNQLCRSVLGWEPKIPASVGLEQTYRWIADQVARTRLAQ